MENYLHLLLEEIESHSSQEDTTIPNISKSGTYWHLDHALKVIIKVNETMSISDPATYQPKFNFLKSMILLTGKIPRGKAKAPKHVLPPEQVSKTDLLQQLEQAKDLVSQLHTLDADCYFNHPMFGHLNVKKAIKFLGIHTEHHLKIVRDISR